jgi:hypothetical protein
LSSSTQRNIILFYGRAGQQAICKGDARREHAKRGNLQNWLMSSAKRKRDSSTVKPVLRFLPTNEQIVSLVKQSMLDFTESPPELTAIIIDYCIGFICIVFVSEETGRPSYIQLDPYKAVFPKMENKDFSDGFLQCSTLDTCAERFFNYLRKMTFLMMGENQNTNTTDADPHDADDYRPRAMTDLEHHDVVNISQEQLLKSLRGRNRTELPEIQLQMVQKLRPWNLWNFVTVEPFENCTSAGIRPRAEYGYGFSGGWHCYLSCLVVDSWFFNLRSNSADGNACDEQQC